MFRSHRVVVFTINYPDFNNITYKFYNKTLKTKKGENLFYQRQPVFRISEKKVVNLNPPSSHLFDDRLMEITFGPFFQLLFHIVV